MIQFNPQDIGMERIMRMVALKRARLAAQAPSLETAQRIRQPNDAMPVLRVRGIGDDEIHVAISANLDNQFPCLLRTINQEGYLWTIAPRQQNFLGFSLNMRRGSPNICAKIILVAELLLSNSIQP